MTNNMATVEIKAFVPAKDFEFSKRFYTDLGFELGWSLDDLAYFHAGGCSFLLQRFYVKEHADNFMMHLLVEDVEAWWRHVESNQLGKKYGVRVLPPADRPWGSGTSPWTIRQAYFGVLARSIESAAARNAQVVERSDGGFQ